MSRPLCTDCGWRPAVSSIAGGATGTIIYLCSICPSDPWITYLRKMGCAEPDETNLPDEEEVHA